MKCELTLSKPIKSRNQLDKMHWSARSRERKAWEAAIKYEGFKGKLIKFETKVKISITSQRPRFLDPDNLVGGCKQLLDALKQLEVIVDDKPQWIDLKVDQIKGKAQTQITLETAE